MSSKSNQVRTGIRKPNTRWCIRCGDYKLRKKANKMWQCGYCGYYDGMSRRKMEAMENESNTSI